MVVSILKESAFSSSSSPNWPTEFIVFVVRVPAMHRRELLTSISAYTVFLRVHQDHGPSWLKSKPTWHFCCVLGPIWIYIFRDQIQIGPRRISAKPRLVTSGKRRKQSLELHELGDTTRSRSRLPWFSLDTFSLISARAAMMSQSPVSVSRFIAIRGDQRSTTCKPQLRWLCLSLDAIDRHVKSSNVPQKLLNVLDGMKRGLVRFQSKEHKGDTTIVLDLESPHVLFDKLIQRTSNCVVLFRHGFKSKEMSHAMIRLRPRSSLRSVC